MGKLTKEQLAFNRGIEAAAKISANQVFCLKEKQWPVGEEIAKLIRAKKKKP